MILKIIFIINLLAELLIKKKNVYIPLTTKRKFEFTTVHFETNL